LRKESQRNAIEYSYVSNVSGVIAIVTLSLAKKIERYFCFTSFYFCKSVNAQINAMFGVYFKTFKNNKKSLLAVNL